MWLPKLLDNNIDDESVLLLGDAELKELIPKIGPRLKFKKLLDELKLEAAQDVTLTNEDALWCNITKTGSETYTDKSSDDVTCAADEPSHTPVAGQGDQNTGCLDGRAVIIEGEASGGLLKEGSRRNHNISQRIYSSLLFTLCCWKRQYCKKKIQVENLYESYITRRRKLRQSGELAGTSRRASSCSSGSTSVTSNFNFDSGDNSDNNEPDDYVENLTFLKNNVEPWGKVEEIWSATSSCRLKNLYRKNNSGIHLKYPALRQPQGYILLMNDFNQLYPEKENSLFSAIEIHKRTIINYAKRKAEHTRDRNLKTTIQSLIALIDDLLIPTRFDDRSTHKWSELIARNSTLTVHTASYSIWSAPFALLVIERPQSLSTMFAWLLLTYIINISPARKKKGKEIIKFSRSEMSCAFINQVASEAHVTSSILERKELLGKQQRSMQPYVIYVGDNCTQIRASYVVINDTVYSFSKLITAVDCAFKIFHSTGACYPEECEDVWLLIQLGFFNIHTKYDRNTQVVKD
ncbi:hypothetical protein ACJJTC_005152 [Scirpophaga incertulas]